MLKGALEELAWYRQPLDVFLTQLLKS